MDELAQASTVLRCVRDLPGPPGIPVLGNVLQLQRERMHQTLEDWNRRYGPIFRMRIAAREIAVFSDPQLIGAVLRDRPEGFRRTRRVEMAAREAGFDGLFSANDERWRRQRPMVLHGLDPTHVKAFFPTLVKVTGRLARRWQRAADGAVAIDLQADLMRYTVDVTAGLAFGTDMNTLESDEQVIQAHLDKVLPALFKRLMAPFPTWRYVKLPSDRRLDAHLGALHRAVDQFIAEARQRLEREPARRAAPPNLIEAMIAERDLPDSPLTDGDVSGNVLTMLLAGEDTTANTLAWLVWLLHANPRAARRATEEVRALLGGAPCPDRHEQLHQLEFVEACLHETMRLKPVAPLIMVEAVRDAVVGDVALPAGSLLMCLMRPGATDERQFADAMAFVPERWLEGGAPAGGPTSAKRASMPFGAGPRMCPGRYLAIAEMKMVVAMLLAGFDIAAVDAPGGGPAQERLAFTMSPVGLTLRLRRAGTA